MNITANRNGLKDLAKLTIDAQFCQQYGTQLFSYQGENSAQFKQLSINMLGVLRDLASIINVVIDQIPVQE